MIVYIALGGILGTLARRPNAVGGLQSDGAK